MSKTDLDKRVNVATNQVRQIYPVMGLMITGKQPQYWRGA